MYFYKIYIEHSIYDISTSIYKIYKHSTVLQCTPFFARYTYFKYIFIYISTVLGGMFGGVVDIASLIACTSTTVRYKYYIYMNIYSSTLTIHEKMRMWDDV